MPVVDLNRAKKRGEPLVNIAQNGRLVEQLFVAKVKQQTVEGLLTLTRSNLIALPFGFWISATALRRVRHLQTGAPAG